MTRLRTARAILGVLAATLMVVLLTLLSCTTLSPDPLKDRVITGCISCSAGLVILVTIMCLLETSNSISAISYGSRETRTEKKGKRDWTWRFSPPLETEKPSRKTWSNRLNGFSMHAETTVQAGGRSTNKENN